MGTIIVGDLHGQWEIADKVLNSLNDIVFVGDYLDSFTRTPEDQIRTLSIVLDAIEEEPDRVKGLVGNHEMSYLQPKIHRCGGWKPETDYMFRHLRSRVTMLLEPYTWVEDHLITHAGVSALLVGEDEEDLEKYLEEGDYSQIGKFRGGFNRCGGIFWCDWNKEFIPIEGVKQVMGHTRGKGIRSTGDPQCKSYCIDCLEDGYEQFLRIHEDGKAYIIGLEDL